MRVVNPTRDAEELAFATKAAAAMQATPRLYTWAEGDPEPGGLFAIRWNPFTILVVRLDDTHVPSLYETHALIGSDLPPLKTSP